MTVPYIVYAPVYIKSSGGWRALHRLSYELNKAGCTSYVTTYNFHPYWVSPYLITDEEIQKTTRKDNAVVIYPEIVHGNPYMAKTSVRWILNVPGKLGGPVKYDKEDLIWGYSKVFMHPNWPENRYLFLDTVERNIFKLTRRYRSGVCYYVGKGVNTPRIKETEFATEITRDWPRDSEKMAEIFQTSDLFISYDNATSLTDMARLCGCPVVLIPGETPVECISKTEMLWDNGIGWGMQEEEKAKSTLDVAALEKKFDDIYTTFQKNLSVFIEETQRVAQQRS